MIAFLAVLAYVTVALAWGIVVDSVVLRQSPTQPAEAAAAGVMAGSTWPVSFPLTVFGVAVWWGGNQLAVHRGWW